MTRNTPNLTPDEQAIERQAVRQLSAQRIRLHWRVSGYELLDGRGKCVGRGLSLDRVCAFAQGHAAPAGPTGASESPRL